MTTIPARLQAVRARIAAACCAAGRAPDDVLLLAVGKTWPAEALIEAARAGQYAFGESYVQEALAKIAVLAELTLPQAPQWHFIGPLQSNKTRAVAEHFDWLHSLDRPKLAERLAVQRPAGMPSLQVCLEVNISGEASKSGCTPQALPDLARLVAELPALRLRGLMAIPAPTDDVQRQRAAFARLRLLRDRLNDELGLTLDTLSMGMSHDLEAAICEGASIVRVGTAIFGDRT